MEIGYENILQAPLKLTMNSFTAIVKDWCNKNTRKPEYILVNETMFQQLIFMFSGEKINIVTNRSSPIVSVRIINTNMLSNYIIVV